MRKGSTRRERSQRVQVMSAPKRGKRRTKPQWRRSLQKLWTWACARAAQARAARPERKLKLLETVALGEKRFVAVVQYEGERYLIGGAATAVSMLARLGASGEFAATLDHLASKIPAQSEPAGVDRLERLIV